MSDPAGTTALQFNKETEIRAEPVRSDGEHNEALQELGLSLEDNGYVKWRTDCTAHPRNWSASRKAFDTGLILLLDLFTTAVSTSGPPVADAAALQYGLTRTMALLAFGSIYQFGQAFGGVFFPPYSEAFGRKPVYITTTILYCVSCIIVGVTYSVAGAIIGRFVSGVMSAVPSVIVSGSLEDMFNMKQRVWLMFIWACATTVGLLLGPIYATFISATLGWRWVFYIAAIVTGLFAVVLFFIRESRPSLLLSKRLAKLQEATGEFRFRIQNPDQAPDLKTFVVLTLTRPVRLFFTDPIVFVVSIMGAVGWALIYLFTEAIPVIYSSFGLTREQSSLMFLAIGLGIVFGIFPRLHDRNVLRKRQEANEHLHPEDKLIGFAFAAPCLAFGLWWLVLSLPPASTLPWYASVVGLVPIGFATNEFACTLSGYLADTYTIYASSAFAALSFLRAVLGGIFPLVGRPMYLRLGSNWASVVLACIATVFCTTPVLFMKFGKGIRQRSKFAKYSFAVNNETQIEDDNVE